MAITIDGSSGISSVDGSAGSPSVRGADSNTGIYYGTDAIYMATAGTERIRVDSDGIKFNGDTGAANALSDYEEGDFTATMTPQGSGSMTLASDVRKLSYTKIGRMVHIYGRIRLDSVSSPSGTVLLGGLPFTQTGLPEQSSLAQFHVSYHGGDLPSDATGPVALEFTNSGTTCFLVYMRDNQGWAGWDAADYDANAGNNYLAMSGIYITNQ